MVRNGGRGSDEQVDVYFGTEPMEEAEKEET
jgi:hypothetical protein